MTALLDVLVPGAPRGASRPRVVRNAGVSRTYMPDAHTRAEAAAVTLLAIAWRGRPPLDEPVVLVLEAVYARPKDMRRKSDHKGRIPCGVKPDLDNVVKLYQDALTKARILSDDGRVFAVIAWKHYAAIEPREEPASVRIRLLPPAVLRPVSECVR